MTQTLETLKQNAELARTMLATGQLSYEEAFESAKRYTDAVNEKAVELAKKYGMKAKLVDPRGFLR